MFFPRMTTAGSLLLWSIVAVAAVSSSCIAGAIDAAAGGPTCVPREREALLAFKRGITSDPADLLASWEPGPEAEHDCCKWGGVRCSKRTGRVLELDLGGGGLVGEISHSLLSLQHLEYLNVSMNSLQGPTGEVPEFLGSFKHLKYLDLSEIPFSGMVPPQLGNLSKLHFLDLSVSGQAQMYSNDLSWLRNLPLLQSLNMGSVNLSMVADWPYVVNTLPSLRALILFDCSLMSATHFLPHLNLTNLKVLDLGLNDFHQPAASCWFWNVTSLEILYLYGAALYGELPDRLGEMVSLQELDLSYMSNNLTMAMTNLRSLCNLTYLGLQASLLHGNITEFIERLPNCSSNKLQELQLESNNLIGSLPYFLGHLTSLTTLLLGGNNISGPLPPSIGNLTNLRTLDIHVNHLSGRLPSEIGKLHNLTRLELWSNDFYGLITEEHFDGLQSLEYIDLSHNQFKIVLDSKSLLPFRLQEAHFASIELGPLFPAWLEWQVDLLRLDISNTSIIDRLPDWFSNTFSKVTYLDISKNQIYGRLPRNMDIMSLGALYFSSNNLTGQIPPLPRSLTTLDISNNSLSGPLPSNFGLPNLNLISLYSNYISGQLPKSFCQLSLYGLNLANNLFEGELPGCINMTGLTYLLLSNNSFSGTFPSFVRRSCSSLSFLDLSHNRFFGILPTWIGNCSTLQFLRVSHNMFHGHFPNSIASLPKLYHLSLAANWISGVMPPHLSNLTSMTKMYILNPGTVPAGFNNLDELLIDTKRQQLHYHSAIVLEMLSIDFSSNYLTGTIPEEITSLDGLVNLNLSRNKLSGVIPDKIGAMQYLESLDLSNNNLVGEIPSSISNLSYLSALDLSNNKLTGRIPSGGQLDSLYTENPSMYDGNSGLCGLPLQRVCTSNRTSDQGNGESYEKLSGEMCFYFGLGIGYAVGLWVVFGALLFHKAWRIAYFRLFDTYYDKVYVFLVVAWKNFTTKDQIN